MEETKEQLRSHEQEAPQEDNGAYSSGAQEVKANSEVLDLSSLIQQMWLGRKLVLWNALVSLLIGIFVVIASPVEYESEMLLLPQSESQGAKGLGFLQQFGISTGGAGTTDMSSISTTLYPEVVASTPYLLTLSNQKISISSQDSSVTLTTYFNDIVEESLLEDIERYTIGLPKIILKLPSKLLDNLKGGDTVANTPEVKTTVDTPTTEETASFGSRRNFSIYEIPLRKAAAINELKKRVEVEVKASGIVSVSSKMPEPKAAAALTALSVTYLTDYIVQYRTEKVKQNLEFIEQQYEESERKFTRAQRELAMFRDRNQNIVTDQGRTELERLQTQYDLYYGIYRNFAQQLEQAKIKLQEETPVFRELEPVKVPSSNSEPNTELILIGSSFFGIFLGVGFLLVKVFWESFAQNINFKT